GEDAMPRPANSPSAMMLLAPTPPLPASSPYAVSHTTLPRPIADAVSVDGAAQPLPVPNPDCENPVRPLSTWFENMSLFFGVDGSKEPADLGVNANFGYRFAFNWGLPVFEETGIGVQVGTAVNYSQNALRILPFIDGTVDRWQSFTTVGLFQRMTNGLRWGL